MKKFILCLSLLTFSFSAAYAADIDLELLDAESRADQPSNNSIMFRHNAEQYRQLTDEQKEEIEEQREIYRQNAEKYDSYMRKKAQYEEQLRARQEQERRRAQALKPIKLYDKNLKIYALVNGEIISSSDMQSRINAFIMTTGIPYNKQTKDMIVSKVLQSAIDEKLKIQEAKKNDIKVTKTEIQKAVSDFEKSNGMTAGQLEKILNSANVRMSVWTSQITSEIAWRKLISKKGYGKISVSEGEINRAMEDIKKDMQTEKYMVSEIVINKKDARNAKELANVLRQDPRFELYAMQFSQSPSAANGGKLGWVLKGKLPPVLEKAVLKLKEGAVSDPVLYAGDYYIFKMDKIFNPKTDAHQLPSRKEVRAFLENKKLEEYSIKYIKDLRNRALIEKKI
ncbi:MAG: peptidylprolyl isomerase [Alphaproteobacteria bacterium]|nr:peptidylprolyl isomerase [Alphaproteobacteria bacterium]